LKIETFQSQELTRRNPCNALNSFSAAYSFWRQCLSVFSSTQASADIYTVDEITAKDSVVGKICVSLAYLFGDQSNMTLTPYLSFDIARWRQRRDRSTRRVGVLYQAVNDPGRQRKKLCM
jgi:hypothetical protein